MNTILDYLTIDILTMYENNRLGIDADTAATETICWLSRLCFHPAIPPRPTPISSLTSVADRANPTVSRVP